MTDVDACQMDPERAARVNWLGTRAIASAAGELGIPLAYLSTDYVFDGRKNLYTESDRPDPVNAYGMTKLMGEREVLRVRGSFVIRTSWVFGPGGRNFLSGFLDQASEGKPLFAIVDQVSCPTYAPWLARELATLVERPIPSGLYHLAGQVGVSYFDFVKKGLELAGLRAELAPCERSELKRPAPRPAMSCLCSWAYGQVTGRAIPGWEQTLKEYVSWWKK